MWQRGVAIAIALLLVWSIAGAIAESEVKEGELSVELDIPDYIPDAESLRHPRKFFSGHRIKLIGDFGDTKDVQAVLVNKATGEQFQLEIVQAFTGTIKTEIPLMVPSGEYELSVIGDGRKLSTRIAVEGLTEEEKKLLEQGGGGAVEEKPLSGAILYTSRIDDWSYWESVLTGHPKDPRFLLFKAKLSGDYTMVSRDGGKTWLRLAHEHEDGLTCCTDPDALITEDGTVVVSGIVAKYEAGRRKATGGIMQGSIAGDSLVLKFFHPFPVKASTRSNRFVDYPKVTYDEATRTLFITGDGVFIEGKGYLVKALFVSKDRAQSFSVIEIDYNLSDLLGTPIDLVGSPVVSPFVNINGELRGVVSDRDYHPQRDPSQTALIKFDKEATSFQLVPGPKIRSPFYSLTKVSSKSRRWWAVYPGPIARIDRSSRHPGRIYMVWADPELVMSDDEYSHVRYNHDVFIAYSDDDGGSWSSPVKVNDDIGKAEQVFPSLEVDNEGTVHVTFIDKRDTIESPEYDVYYAKIVDGKVSRNIRVNAAHIYNRGGIEPGDYMDMLAAYPSIAYVSYPCPELDDYYDWPKGTCLSALDPRRVTARGEFLRADSNQDIRVDMSDAIAVINTLYLTGNRLYCTDGADANDDGVVDVSDAVYILNWLFSYGPEPKPPFPNVGSDPTPDALDC